MVLKEMQSERQQPGCSWRGTSKDVRVWEVGRLILQSPGVVACRGTCRVRKRGKFIPWSSTTKDFIASFCYFFLFFFAGDCNVETEQ